MSCANCAWRCEYCRVFVGEREAAAEAEAEVVVGVGRLIVVVAFRLGFEWCG